MKAIQINNRTTMRAMACMAMLLICSAAMADQKKEQPIRIDSDRKVVVSSFDPRKALNDAGDGTLADAVGDMLTTELSNMGAMLLERQQLKRMIQERCLGTMGIVDEQTAAPLGQQLGAEWMICGQITEMGIAHKRIGFGPVAYTEEDATVKVNARIVDVRTGLILDSEEAEGCEKKSGVDVNGIGAGMFDHISAGDSEWTNSMFGKSTRKAIHGLAYKFGLNWANSEAKWKRAGGTASSGLLSPSDTPKPLADLSALKGVSVIVVMPETIFLHPRVPDPAAETEVIHELLEAGVRVIDDQRSKELANDREVLAMLRGGVDSAKLQELHNIFGADILIVGEAIAEQDSQQIAGTGTIFSRARVEMRAIKMDTGDILAADGEHGAGSDLTEILAGKNALQLTAKKLTPKFMASMAKQLANRQGDKVAGRAKVSLEISGWVSFGNAQQFLNDLLHLPGVQTATRDDFRGGILFATVEFSTSELKDLALALESAQAIKKYMISVQTANATKIEGRAGR